MTTVIIFNYQHDKYANAINYLFFSLFASVAANKNP